MSRRWGRAGPLPASAALLSVLATLAVPAAGCGGPPRESLTVVSWGGSYAHAIDKGYLEPFASETGIDIRIEDYNGGLAQVRAQVETGNVHWDVVDLETADAVSGCDEGILERIDSAALPPGPDGAPAMEDFLPGSLFECAVGILFYSTVYAYNPERIAGEPPATMADFFDLERFPGRRGMRRVPHANLEFALIADGVPLDQVYATLDTPEGVDRAFRKLDTVKDQVVWWEAGAQPPQMLADGEVVMSTAYNGRIFNAQALEAPAVRHRLGRPDPRCRSAGDRRRDAGPRGGPRARPLRHHREVDGRRRPLHRLQPRASLGAAAHREARGGGHRHESAHAAVPCQRRPRPAERLGVVERPRGRDERAIQRMVGPLSRPINSDDYLYA